MMGNARENNKIAIEDWAPKEIASVNKTTGKKKWGGKSMKSSQTGDQEQYL